jgi:steroid 5-alpha reductase family enzyme
MLAFLVLETIADQQQYVFQQSKYNLLPRQEALQADYQRGFRTTGLFAWSRHPNYLGELGVWWSLYLIGVFGVDKLLHWSMIGPFLLTLLFIGSTWFTEGITTEKYPAYQEYRKQVWPIFPKPKVPQTKLMNPNSL